MRAFDVCRLLKGEISRRKLCNRRLTLSFSDLYGD